MRFEMPKDKKLSLADAAAVAQVMLDLPKDLAMPEGLSARGAQAWEVIVQFLVANGLTYTGGCGAFMDPKEWRERGGEYGCESVLVVFHEGSEVGAAFSMDHCYERGGGRASSYAKLEAMQAELAKIGLFAEQCTRTYSAVYEIQKD
jgi:hypothetical protein